MAGLLALAMTFAGCTKTIDFETGSAEAQPVISGYVRTVPGKYAINISSTAPFFGGDSVRRFNDALVSINGEALTLNDSIDGRYETADDFCAVPGETYTLLAELDFDGDGVREKYSATAVAPETVELRSLLLQPLSNEADGPFTPFSTIIIFQDPVGDNYYGAHIYVTTARDSADSYTRYHISNTASKYVLNYFDADVEDGSLLFYPAYMITQRILHTPTDTLTIYPGDTIELELNNHSPEYFEYLDRISSSASGDNPIFSTPSGTLSGNISGGALGAFGVYSASVQKAVVPYRAGTWSDERMTKRFGRDWRKIFEQ